MATLSTQSVKRTGLNPSYAAAAGGGDKFSPGDHTLLHVKNGSGSGITVTIVTPGQAFPDAEIADVAVTIPAGGERMIGPFPAAYFASPTDGLASVSYSAATTVTVAAIELSAR